MERGKEMINLTTEQDNPASAKIDQMTALEIVRLINREDATVAAAVQEALPQIAEAVDAIAEALANGGRLFYIGAGTSGRLGLLDAVECVPTFSAPPDLAQAVIAGGGAAVTRSIEGAEDQPEGGAARPDRTRADWRGRRLWHRRQRRHALRHWRLGACQSHRRQDNRHRLQRELPHRRDRRHIHQR